mgnify:FL=1
MYIRKNINEKIMVNFTVKCGETLEKQTEIL